MTAAQNEKLSSNNKAKADRMADVTLIKTAAEQQLATEWQEAKARLPGPVLLRAAF